jgi:hypothetical protein
MTSIPAKHGQLTYELGDTVTDPYGGTDVLIRLHLHEQFGDAQFVIDATGLDELLADLEEVHEYLLDERARRHDAAALADYMSRAGVRRKRRLIRWELEWADGENYSRCIKNIVDPLEELTHEEAVKWAREFWTDLASCVGRTQWDALPEFPRQHFFTVEEVR